MLNKTFFFKLGVILLAFSILLFSITFQAFKIHYSSSKKIKSNWLIKIYFNHLKDTLYPFKNPHFYSTLATKRLNEANFLWHQKHFNLAKKQLVKAINYYCLSKNPTPFPLPVWAQKLSPTDPYYWWIKHIISCPKKNLTINPIRPISPILFTISSLC